MFDSLKEIAQRWQAVAEVDKMTDRDCSDLGVSRSQLRSFAGIPGSVPNRMSQMAAVFDADLSKIERDRDLYLNALEACHTCGSARRCKSLLAKSGIERAQPAQAGFCPNSGLYAANPARHPDASAA